jgi:uncharacterized protein
MLLDTMQINVAQLLKEPIGSSCNYRIDGHLGTDDINFVNGDVTLIRTNRGIIVKGKMTASVTGICSRCLKQINCEVSYDFEEEALPDIVTSEGFSSTELSGNLIIDEGHMLDLSEVVRQYALLTMPAKPLCRLDCAGICPSCGQDLNREPCHCPSSTHDQRWSKLIRLGKESRT